MASKTQWAWIGLLTILVLVAGTGAAYAYPSFFSGTGGVQTPSPEVVPTGQFDLAADYWKTKSRDTDVTTWPIRLVAGVSERAELGIAYTRVTTSGGEDANVSGAGGKYLITQEAEKGVDLGVGANYLSWSDGGDLDMTQLYAVVGKNLTPKTEAYAEPSKTKAYGYIGAMYTRFSPSGGASESFTEPFVGLVLSGEGGALALEWQRAKFGDDITSAVLRYQFNPMIAGEVGVTNNLGGESEVGTSHRVFAGLSYRFGTPKGEGRGW